MRGSGPRRPERSEQLLLPRHLGRVGRGHAGDPVELHGGLGGELGALPGDPDRVVGLEALLAQAPGALLQAAGDVLERLQRSSVTRTGLPVR